MSQTTNPEKATSALQSLDPNMGRGDWFKVCAAARAAGLEFDAFDQWSAGGDSYNPSDCRSTWNSLPPKEGGIGPSTLFGMAKAGGWRGEPNRQQRTTNAREDFAPHINLAALMGNAAQAGAPAPAATPTEATQTPAAAPQPAPAPEALPEPPPSPAALAIWNRATPLTLAHHYCQTKKLTDPAAVAGLRVLADTDWLELDGIKMAGALVVPLYRPDTGELQSVQCIAPDGQKRTKGRMANACFTVGAIEPGKPVYIVEGIGAAWAVQAAGGAAVVTFGVSRTGTVATAVQTQPPGAQVVLLPDTGQEKEAAKVAKKLDCPVVLIDQNHATAPEYGKNYDAWDYLDNHGPEALADLLNTADKPHRKPERAPLVCGGGEVPTAAQRPAYVVFNERYNAPTGESYKPGVWYFATKTKGKGEDAVEVETQQWICSPLHVLAITADAYDASYGRLLEFKTTRGNWQQWSMPMRMMAGDGNALREVLLDMGVEIHPLQKTTFTLYLHSRHPEKHLQCVAQTGWVDSQCKAFVLPGATIGPNAEDVAYQCDSAKTAKALYRTGGTLDGWRAGVAAVAVGNPMLALGICTAFAGPLLGLLRAESGGLHLIGDSSTGKTSILEAGRSVWGGEDFKRTWRATANGLEGAAAMFTDALLTLDEIKQCAPKEVDEAVYMIANGQGKARAEKSGGGRAVARWRVSVLSNGEMSVATKLAEGKLRIHAGQQVRLVDIPCGGRTFEVWDNLHHYDSARAFADGVKAQAATHYGHAARAFLEGLTKDNTADLVQALESIRAMPELATNGESQEQRVAGRFAVLALAGELATDYGVTGWPPGEAIRAAGVGLEAWRNSCTDKAGANAEHAQIVQAVTDFISRHGDSRFSDADAPPSEFLHQPITHNRAGYWRKTDAGRVYFFNGPGLREALEGHDFKRSLKKLQDAGLMPPSTGRNSGKQFTIQGKKDRWYQVAPNAAHDAQEGSE